MTTTTTFEPSTGWKNQAPEVRERFAKMKKRPVTLDVYKLGKSYDAPQGGTVEGKVVALRYSPSKSGDGGEYAVREVAC